MRSVIVRATRPEIKPGNNWNEVTSQIVNEQLMPIGEPKTAKMRLKEIRKIFGNAHTAYYLAEFEEGQPVRVVQPVLLEEWS